MSALLHDEFLYSYQSGLMRQPAVRWAAFSLVTPPRYWWFGRSQASWVLMWRCLQAHRKLAKGLPCRSGQLAGSTYVVIRSLLLPNLEAVVAWLTLWQAAHMRVCSACREGPKRQVNMQRCPPAWACLEWHTQLLSKNTAFIVSER